MIVQNVDLLDIYEKILSERRIGLVVIDPNSRIVKVNQAFCEIVGFEEKDLLGQSAESCLTCISNGEEGNREIPIVHPSGRTVWARCRVHSFVSSHTCIEMQQIEGPDGRIACHEMLNKQQGMTFAFKKIDGKFIHTFVDGELVYRLGSHPKHIIGKEMKDFLGEEAALEKEPYYERAWAGESIQYERKNGDITYLASLKPIVENGVTVEVIATCVEITERSRMEEALREAEAKYRILVEEAIIGICMIQDDIISYVNPFLSKRFGYSQDDFIGKSPFQFIVPDDRPLLEQSIENIFRRKNGPPIHIGGIHRDGSRIELEVYGAVITMNDRPAVLGMLLDVTEKRLTEEMLQKSEKLSVIGQLAAGIAHEIRNPLTSLKGFVQLIKRNDKSNQYYDIMQSELDRINLIVNELLIVAKPQASSYRNNDVCAIVKDVILLLESQALLNNVEIHMNHPDEPVFIECEGNQIKQMFINFMKNSIEAMPCGGRLAIDINTHGEDKVSVRISDDGCGIPEERIPRLGEPFYSTKDKGTGLGLMMCYKIIQEHRGYIRIDSEIGKGTTVEVTLLRRMP